MSIIFPVTNMQVSENTALLIKENTTLYVDALNENAVITLPEPTENPNLFLNIINTSILHQLVILDVITLNPNSGISLKCDGKKWIYETLNSESLYMLSLSNGMSGSEVHNLTQIFNTTNNFNNLSEKYRSFLTVSPDQLSIQPSLDHSKLQQSEFILNGSKYEYTSTVNGIGYFRFELSSSQNIQVDILKDGERLSTIYTGTLATGISFKQLVIEKGYVYSISNTNITSIKIKTVPFKELSISNNNSSTSAEIKLDYDNKITNDITSSLTQDDNYDIYTYTSTVDGLITINLVSNLNGGIFYITESDTNYVYYCTSGRNGANTCSFIIGKNRSLIIKNGKDRSTNCTITEIPFKELTLPNNNSSEESSPTTFEFDVTYPLLDFENGISLEYLSKSTFTSKPYHVYYTMPFDGMIQLNIQAGSSNNFSNWGNITITRDNNSYPIDSIKCTNGINYINCYAKKDDEILFTYYYVDGSVIHCMAYPFLKETITSDNLNTSTSSKITYSTQKEIQIGTYEDGRPVYRRIFRGPGISAGSTSMTVPGSDELANVVDIVLRLDGIYHWSSAGNYYPINFLRNDTEYSRINYNSNSGIKLNLTIPNWVDAEYTIIFEYVKK